MIEMMKDEGFENSTDFGSDKDIETVYMQQVASRKIRLVVSLYIKSFSVFITANFANIFKTFIVVFVIIKITAFLYVNTCDAVVKCILVVTGVAIIMCVTDITCIAVNTCIAVKIICRKNGLAIVNLIVDS
ncbi:hypothetical protein HELRODRAFT_178595 [Helobdella robusta]|uniref:Uncharacterized protein n=1 Tax=Helobdella robusta TaxID=6412 RepID=T1FDF8_HELRO|nr:hypothetical protein HELRODRAFT_178595 [Helobdella robusta]ESN96806.1 hypothetical protein HELRODRAFT_178595 [Helobdella robusta]